MKPGDEPVKVERCGGHDVLEMGLGQTAVTCVTQIKRAYGL